MSFGRCASAAHFSIVISGPPCFMSSLGYPSRREGTTQRGGRLACRSLFDKMSRLLSRSKRFAIIIPASISSDVGRITSGRSLCPYERLGIVAGPKLPPGEALVAFIFGGRRYQARRLLVRLAHRRCDGRCVRLAERCCLGVWWGGERPRR